MIRSLFPAKHIEKYLDQYILPDELSEIRVQAHCFTSNEFLNYNHNILLFLESNAIYDNMFTLQGPAFEALFKRHAHYYAELNSTQQTLELLRTEQAIYFITDLSPATQDISSYLKIVEHLCDKEEICELILLLSKKHSTWCEGYSEQYEKWLHFLTPFFQHSQFVMFEGNRLLTLKDVGTPFLSEMIKTNVSYLKFLLVGEGKKIMEELDEGRLGDAEYVLEQVLKFKTVIVNDSQFKGYGFYYKLGVLSFIIHLAKFCAGQGDALLKISLLTTLYIDAFEEFKKVTKSELLKSTLTEEKVWNPTFWKRLLDPLCKKLQDKGQSPISKTAHIQALQCLLCVMETKRKNSAALDKELVPFVLESIKTIYQNREIYSHSQSSYSGDFLNHNENYVWDILLLMKLVQPAISKDPEALKEIYERVLDIVKSVQLRPFIQDKCFKMMRELAVTQGNKVLPSNWNLEGVNLKNMMKNKQKQNIGSLAVNLKASLELFVSQSSLSSQLEDFQYEDLVEIYEIYISQIKKSCYTKEEIQKFKHIGMFLVGILRCINTDLEEVRAPFLSSFIDFLMKHCELSCWDIYYLQEHFWTALQSTDTFKKITTKPSFSRLIAVIQREAIKSQFTAKIFPNRGGLKFDNAKMRRELNDMVIESLEDIEESIKREYSGFDWNNVKCEQKQREKIYMIKLFQRKFMYFTTRLIECFLKTNETVQPEILKRMVRLYFHPSFWIFSEKTELKILDDCFVQITSIAKNFKWTMYQAFYQAISDFARDLNQDIRIDGKYIEGFILASRLQQINMENDRDRYHNTLKSLSPQAAMFCSLMVRLKAFIQLLDTIQKTKKKKNECGPTKQQETALGQISRSAVESLIELASHFGKSKSSSVSSNENGEAGIIEIIKFIAVGIRDTTIPLQKFRNLGLAAEDLLSELFVMYMKNAHKQGSQYILHLFETLTTPSEEGKTEQNWKQALCQKGVLTFVVRRVYELISPKDIEEKEYKAQLDSISRVVSLLKSCLGSNWSIKVTKKATHNKNILKQKNRDFIPNLFYELDDALENFPILGLILKENDTLTETFKTVLSIFTAMDSYVCDQCSTIKSNYNRRYRDDPQKIARIKKEADDLTEKVTEKFYARASLMSVFYDFSYLSKPSGGIKHVTLEKIWSSCRKLIQELISLDSENMQKVIKQDNFLERWQDLMAYISKGIVNLWTEQCSKKQDLDTLVRKTGEWVEIVFKAHIFIQKHKNFDLISAKGSSLLENIEKLAHLDILFGAHTLSTYSPLVKIMLALEKKNSWRMTNVFSMAFMLDNFMKSTLPNPMQLHLDLKRILMSSTNWQSSLKLSNLDKDDYIREKEQTHMQSLINVLTNKFRIYSSCEDTSNEKAYSLDNLCITIDVSQEVSDPASSIEFVLRNLSEDAKVIINLLMEALIENFLVNISSIKAKSTDGKFRETSNIMVILSIFLQKYRQLACYIVFQKFDYRSLVGKYRENSIDENLKLEDFCNITFIECLFKFKYFSYNNEDFSMLVLNLLGPTGVTFATSENADSVLDASFIIINKLFGIIQNLFEENCQRNTDGFIDSVEKFIGLQASIYLFSFLWYQVRQIYNKNIFGKYFKDLFLNGLNVIISHLPDIIAEYSCYPEICNLLLDCLPEQIRYHCDKEYDASADEIIYFKRENYKQLLGEYHKAEEIHLLKQICEQINIKTEEYHTKLDSNVEEKKIPNTGSHTEKKDEIRSWPRTKTLSFTLAERTYFHLKSWEKVRLEMTSKIKEFCSSALLNETERLVSDSLANYFNWNGSGMEGCRTQRAALGDIIPHECATALTRINPEIFEAASDDLKFKRYYHIIAERLKAKNFTQEQENGIEPLIMDIEYEKNTLSDDDDDDEEEEISISKEEEKKNVSSSETCIKYFKYLELKTKNDFEIIRNQILSRLKLISEKILVESICCSQDEEEIAVRKEAINCEIKDHMKDLPEFERNLYLCLIEEFDVLSCFEYPVNFIEIKEEYRWIVTNFNEYINILAWLRGEPGNSSNIQSAENINAGVILTKDFCFCHDHTVTIKQKTNIEIKISEDVIQAVKTLFSPDDSVVESIITCFYFTSENSSLNKHLEIISQLCNSALFEAKLVDYSFFFLYSQDYLELAKQQGYKLPDAITYNDVAHNVLYFLNDLLQNKDYLLYQPRVYFEESGLKSLRQLKTQSQFYNQTTQMASIADLLIGLLDLKHVQDDEKLNKMLKSLIQNIFSKPTQFDVVEGKAGQEMIEKNKAITRKSGQRLMQGENSEALLESLVNFIPVELGGIIQTILKQQKDMSQSIRDIALAVKYMDSMKEEQQGAQLSYIMTIHNYEADLGGLEKSLRMLSFLLSSWVLDENDWSEHEQNTRNELLKESFKTICHQILEDKDLSDFMSDIFCITTYLPGKKNLDGSETTESALACLFNICVHYYTLYCVQEEVLQAGIQVNTITERPNKNFNRFEGIMKEVNQSMKEKQSYFEELFTAMYKANKQTANMVISEDLKANLALLKSGRIISNKLPWVMLGFESKKKNLMSNITKDLKELDSTETRKISIERRNLVLSTVDAFANKPLKVIKQKVYIEFQNEYGIDGGGLRKEWLTIINRELFNPQTGLFQLGEDNVSLQISPNAKNIPSHLKYLQLAGMMLAKTIQEENVVDITLSNSLLKDILKMRATLNDLKNIDPSLKTSLEWILNNSTEDLDQDFTYETEAFGNRTIKELVQNGCNVSITDSNKREFVQKICEVKMKGGMQEEIKAFIQGFYLIIPADFLQGIFPSELQLLISGPSTIDVNEMKSGAKYTSYTKDCSVVRWLWELLSSFGQTELSAFVLFVTGSPKIPYGGLKSRSFNIQKCNGGPNILPKARTCSWVIEIPMYRSKEELRQKLLLAIFDGQGSFMFG